MTGLFKLVIDPLVRRLLDPFDRCCCNIATITVVKQEFGVFEILLKLRQKNLSWLFAYFFAQLFVISQYVAKYSLSELELAIVVGIIACLCEGEEVLKILLVASESFILTQVDLCCLHLYQPHQN